MNAADLGFLGLQVAAKFCEFGLAWHDTFQRHRAHGVLGREAGAEHAETKAGLIVFRHVDGVLDFFDELPAFDFVADDLTQLRP